MYIYKYICIFINVFCINIQRFQAITSRMLGKLLRAMMNQETSKRKARTAFRQFGQNNTKFYYEQKNSNSYFTTSSIHFATSSYT